MRPRQATVAAALPGLALRRSAAALGPALALAVALALALAPTAHAQRNLDVERFSPAPDGDGLLSITGTRTPGPWRWNLALWLGFTQSPLTARLPDGTSLPIVGDRFGGDLLFQVGVLGRFALVVDVPLVVYQNGSPGVIDGGGPLISVGLRDPRVAVRARVLGEDATEERPRHEGEGVAVQVAGTVPIGQEQAYLGEGAPTLDAQVLADFHLLGLGVGGVLGFRHRFAEPRVLGVPFRNELFFGIGIQVPAFFVDHVDALAEITVHTDAENAFGNEASTAVEWLFGVRGRVRDLELTLAGGTGLTSGVGTSAYRILGGMSWAPRVHDRDHDGILDDQDACETLPEDFDGYRDDDGCPEPDNDGDLVPDLDDRCPNEAADFGRDLDDDGCNDPGTGSGTGTGTETGTETGTGAGTETHTGTEPPTGPDEPETPPPADAPRPVPGP